MVINEHSARKILPVASGKGGVGKTIVAANLALDLAVSGKRTVAVDLDLGGSNLHTALGMKNKHLGIGNFLSSRTVKFRDIVVDTPYENLRFIPGDVLVSDLADIQFSQKRKLLQNLLDLDTDYVVIDLGSGGSCHVVDYFLISNSGFVVVTPQSTSLVNAYGLLKNVVFRFLQRAFASNMAVSSHIKKVLKEKKPNSFQPLKEVLEKFSRLDRQAGEKARRYLSALQPKFVVNMAQKPEDIQIVEQLKELVKKNLEIDVECMGVIYRDEAVDRSLEEAKPLLTTEGDSMFARQISRISQKIQQSDAFPRMPLDLDYYADTYELALIEAQNDLEDFQSPAGEAEDAAADAAAMLAIISEQKRQIDDLRGTVRMLTLKNR